MKKVKVFHFNNYAFTFELLLIFAVAFATVCCERNQSQQVLSTDSGKITADNALNINTATAEEIGRLPSIGPKQAEKIIEFREKYGKFRRPEEIILVDGMSDEKFRRIRSTVRIE